MISIVWGQIFTNFFNGMVSNPDPTDVEQFTHSLDSAMSYLENDAVFHMGGHRKPVPRNIMPRIKEIISEDHFPEIPEDMKGLVFTLEAEDFPEYVIPEVEVEA